MNNICISSNYENRSVEVRRNGTIDQIVSISLEFSNVYPMEIIGYRFSWKWFENDPADRCIGQDKAIKLVERKLLMQVSLWLTGWLQCKIIAIVQFGPVVFSTEERRD